MKQNKKISCGIVCYRNVISGAQQRHEILLIKKRITYAFSVFVNGLYDPHNRENIMRVLNAMTVDEKILVLSQDFGAMWKHIWLSLDPKRAFIQCLRKFEDAFMVDGGERLKRLIWATTSSGQLRWEIPKGRKTHPEEMDLQCAVREFIEETGISKSSFTIYPSLKRKELYSDDGRLYETIYFGAVTRGNFKLMVSELDQMSEISDIRWATLQELRILDAGSYEKLARVAKPLINALKKRSK
jgi:8-oxo-dGTP pyrophosphatase MutT (NUDIX family)